MNEPLITLRYLRNGTTARAAADPFASLGNARPAAAPKNSEPADLQPASLTARS